MIALPLQKENKVKSKKSPPTIQTKLGASNHKYKLEADQMTNHIMRMPQVFSSQPLSKGGNGIQRKCSECEKEEKYIQRKPLMMKSDGVTPIATTVLSSQLNSTKGSGSSLPSGTNSFMSNAFGTDFSNVRVHTSNKAQQITHVVQQHKTSTTQIQRNAPANQTVDDVSQSETTVPQQVPRKDIVFVMAFEEAAKLVSTGAQFITIKSPKEMANALKSITFPIGTIYIFSHSTATANIKFPDTGYVSASTLAMIIKGKIDQVNAPQTIDFRGCSVGMSPSGMETIRRATGAKTVIGSTCYLVFKTLPLTVNNVHIKTKNQLKNKVNKRVWKKHFKNYWKKFDSKDCVLDKSKNAYFKAGGYLVSIFANKKFTTDFSQDESICYKNLSVQELTPQQALTQKPSGTETCKLIRVDGEPQSPSTQIPLNQLIAPTSETVTEETID